MSMLVRAAPLRAARVAAARQQVRFAHFENVVDKTIPTSVNNKFGLAAKMGIYITCGFGLPFFASWYQIQKAKGA
ncbi:hypothetical protein CC85DRAFT_303187 [Cutaneotrichosporon oleaginosum]|uniref:Cytochrome c oxidase subunit 8, mitochondrial n=1 Tax=Cutaneotrichosporon oleaginosum TaxID=879819 RepID=A0A0J1B1L6_9TREE|nr:uncharacterized protein CC85DRAFT_303187 [Cutaneotrichosporon oleaginosum]KLT41509.1 hypothetical protein CC85DRAFT_303187 [Cutaneotrichosporon oleaginosum]TXT05842.1 hypothetical protein COLE_07162 [Cutaneotrichosporon oleaginosum]